MATDNWTRFKESLRRMKEGQPGVPPQGEPFKPFAQRMMEYDYNKPAQAISGFFNKQRPLYPSEMRDQIPTAPRQPQLVTNAQDMGMAFGPKTEAYRPEMEPAVTTLPNQPAAGGANDMAFTARGFQPQPQTPAGYQTPTRQQPPLGQPASQVPTARSRYLDMYHAGEGAQNKFIASLPESQAPIELIRGRTATYRTVPTGDETQTTRTAQGQISGKEMGEKYSGTTTGQTTTRTAGSRQEMVDAGGISTSYWSPTTRKEYETPLEAAYGVRHPEEVAGAAAAAQNATELEKARITAAGKVNDKVKKVVKTESVGPDGIPTTQNTLVFESGKTKPLEGGQNGIMDLLNMIKNNQPDFAAQAMMNLDQAQRLEVINSLGEEEATDLIGRMRKLSEQYTQQVK